ncbi:MAG TPA: metallophosphoesterase family protein [Thermomicrobiales bacterium]|jgi:predicted phosphodiesterase
MRIGLIADIHGNPTALETILARLDRDRVDQIVCLGDVAALGPQPGAVVARLRDLGCPCVLGNTDAWLIPDPPLAAEPATTAPIVGLTRWCAGQLSAGDRSFIGRLPVTYRIDLGHGRTLLAFHAAPHSLDDVIAATTPATDIASMFAGYDADVFAGGHTHVQLLRRHGQIHIVNPGSIGLPGVGPGGPDLPVNHDVDWAEYAVIEASDDELSIAFRRVGLDVAKMRAIAAASGMPYLDWWTARWSTG